jgi:hypothetical protein
MILSTWHGRSPEREGLPSMTRSGVGSTNTPPGMMSAESRRRPTNQARTTDRSDDLRRQPLQFSHRHSLCMTVSPATVPTPVSLEERCTLRWVSTRSRVPEGRDEALHLRCRVVAHRAARLKLAVLPTDSRPPPEPLAPVAPSPTPRPAWRLARARWLGGWRRGPSGGALPSSSRLPCPERR